MRKGLEPIYRTGSGAGSGGGKNPMAPAPPHGMHVKSEAQDPGDFNQLSPSNLQRMNRLSPRAQPGSSLSLCTGSDAARVQAPRSELRRSRRRRSLSLTVAIVFGDYQNQVCIRWLFPLDCNTRARARAHPKPSGAAGRL